MSLFRATEEANQFLPHSDDETDKWLLEILNGKSYGDIVHDVAYELKPTFIVHESLKSPSEINYWVNFAYTTWKKHGITKIFGERGS